MSKSKTIALISFYDRVSLGMRLLSTILKESGHRPYLFYFKDDRSGILDQFKPNNLYFQYFNNGKYIGTGEDVNPPTENEYNLLIDKLLQLQPDIIGITSRSVALDTSKHLITLIRRVLPEALYIGGGYGPTLEPEKYLDFLDFLCIGEGEKVVSDLVSANSPATLKNIAWKQNDRLFINKLESPQNLDDVGYPDWDTGGKYMIEDDKIKPVQECFDSTTYDIFASRGCPNTCTYCMSNHLDVMYKRFGEFMPRIRLRSPESTIRELEMAKEKYGIRYVRFKDSIFGFNKKWFYKFMDLYDNKIGLPFTCYLEINFIDEDRIKRLKESGLNKTTVGIQSTTYALRKAIMGRNTTDDELLEYANMLIENDIELQYDIIHWNPFDTHDTLKEGMKFLKRLPKGCDNYVIDIVMFPGSRLLSLYESEKPTPLSFEEYEYYAWLFQMILYSNETTELADSFEENGSSKDDLKMMKTNFYKTISKSGSRYTMTTQRDIEKGETLTRVLVNKFVTKDLCEGVAWEEKDNVFCKIVKRPIKKGSIVKWDDVYGAYEDKGK